MSTGAYTVVRFGDKWYPAKPPLRETFHVFFDKEGTLRTVGSSSVHGRRFNCTTDSIECKEAGR
jgi:hypothetical protein